VRLREVSQTGFVACLVIASLVFVLGGVADRASAQTIAVTSPSSSSVWDGGGTYEITWTSAGGVGPNVKIEYDYLFYAVSTAVEIVASTPNDGSYNWTIPAGITPRTTYLVRVSDAGDDTVFDDSPLFEIRAVSRTILVTAPATGSVWTTGQTITITWTTSGPVGPNVKIEYDYLIYLSVTAIEIVASTPNDGSYNWTIPAGIPARPNYFVRVSDASDDSVFDESGWVEIRSPPIDPMIILLLVVIVVVVVVIVIGLAVRAGKKKKAAAPPSPPAGVYPAPPPYPPTSYGAPAPPPPGAKTCWNCGTPLPPGATTCGKCGSYV